MRGTKEFYDIMKAFENAKIARTSDFTREKRNEDGSYIKGYYYCNGETNIAFIGFLAGYQYAKSLARIDDLPLEG